MNDILAATYVLADFVKDITNGWLSMWQLILLIVVIVLVVVLLKMRRKG